MKQNNKLISCPVGDCSCPYWHDGFCTMFAEGDGHPFDECDDYIGEYMFMTDEF